MPLTLVRQVKNKLVTKIVIGIAAFIVIVLVVIAAQPSDFRMTRSTLISAPPSEVFPQVNDHHNFLVWSPFNKPDPNIKESFEGPTSGAGAIYRWSGNSQVGEGTCTIVESRSDEMVRMKLEFQKPFVGTNEVIFTVKPEGDKTKLTWDMTGKKNFVMKGCSLLMNMDKMCGDQFEKGLSTLKTLVEPSAPSKS